MPRELTESDKMQLKGIGDLQAPSAFCAVCGNGTCEDGYLDFGLWIEFHGQVYFCATCLSQAAETAGMLSKIESDFLINQNKEIAEEFTKMKSKVADYEQQLSAYDSIADGIANRRSISISGPNAYAQSADVKSSDGESPSGVSELGKENESVITESVKNERRTDASRSELGNFSI